MGPNYSISTACATANYAFVSGAPPAAGCRPDPRHCPLHSLLSTLPLCWAGQCAGACRALIDPTPLSRSAAANHIRNGDADVMVAGGSEAPIIPVGLGGFVACRCAQRQRAAGLRGCLQGLPLLLQALFGRTPNTHAHNCPCPLPSPSPAWLAARLASGMMSRSGRRGRGMPTAMVS